MNIRLKVIIMKVSYILAIVLFSLFLLGTCYSQALLASPAPPVPLASATQTLTLTVQGSSAMSVSLSTLTITLPTATAGNDPAATTNATSTYSITHNSGSAKKITARIDVVMPAYTSLTVALASTKGSSSGTVNISGATTDVDVVTGIAKGKDNIQSITYVFSADASVEAVVLTRNVTFTLTD